MKDLNLINKIYLLFTLVLIVGIGFRLLSYKSWDRYYYFSSSMAPQSYPLAVRNAYFILPNDEHSYINNENIRNFNTNWGEEYYFPEVHETLRLPEKLVLEYVSYRDQKFYKDTLSLPTPQLKQLFAEAVQQKQLDKMYSPKGDQMGLRFLIGLANDGQVLVWIRGIGLEKLILKAKLQPYQPTMEDTYYEKPLPKAQYLKKMFEQLPDSIKHNIAKGWDKDANYADSATHYLETKH